MELSRGSQFPALAERHQNWADGAVGGRCLLQVFEDPIYQDEGNDSVGSQPKPWLSILTWSNDLDDFVVPPVEETCFYGGFLGKVPPNHPF